MSPEITLSSIVHCYQLYAKADDSFTSIHKILIFLDGVLLKFIVFNELKHRKAPKG
jgi:hypothetical protein